MQCPFCKNEISDDAKFCTVCGAQIKKTDEYTASASASQYVHYKAPEAGFNPADSDTGADNNVPPYGTYMPPCDAGIKHENNIPPYGNEEKTGSSVPPYGNTASPYNETGSGIKQYVKSAKDIKILAIAGVCTSLGYVGIILAIISFVFMSRLPAEGSFFIPAEYASQYEDAKKSVSLAKTINIITVVICVIRFIL